MSGVAQLELGPVGRLGRFAATHFRVVMLAWLVLAVVLGFLAPRVESALSGAGWESAGSESVAARDIVQQHFDGRSSTALLVVVHSDTETTDAAPFAAVVRAAQDRLAADPDVASVAAPTDGGSISSDRHTALIVAGAAGTPTEMVAAADRLKGPLRRSRRRRRLGRPHRCLGDVVGLQHRQP